jgi:hypothetical protein
MARIYVANYSPSGSDLKSLSPIGDFVFVTEGIIYTPIEKLHELFRKAFEYATPEDYLVVTGPQSVVAVAYYEWCKKLPLGSVFFWNKRDKKYYLHNLNLQDAEKSIPQ